MKYLNKIKITVLVLYVLQVEHCYCQVLSFLEGRYPFDPVDHRFRYDNIEFEIKRRQEDWLFMKNELKTVYDLKMSGLQ